MCRQCSNRVIYVYKLKLHILQYICSVCCARRVPPLRATVRLRFDITKQSRRHIKLYGPVSHWPNGCTWWWQVMHKPTPTLCPWRTIKKFYSTSVLGRCSSCPSQVATSDCRCVSMFSPWYNQRYTGSADASTPHLSRAASISPPLSMENNG